MTDELPKLNMPASGKALARKRGLRNMMNTHMWDRVMNDFSGTNHSKTMSIKDVGVGVGRKNESRPDGFDGFDGDYRHPETNEIVPARMLGWAVVDLTTQKEWTSHREYFAAVRRAKEAAARLKGPTAVYYVMTTSPTKTLKNYQHSVFSGKSNDPDFFLLGTNTIYEAPWRGSESLTRHLLSKICS